jgi:hypothetical protein
VFVLVHTGPYLEWCRRKSELAMSDIKVTQGRYALRPIDITINYPHLIGAKLQGRSHSSIFGQTI